MIDVVRASRFELVMKMARCADISACLMVFLGLH